MSGLFRKEVRTSPPPVITETPPAAMSFLGKGTRASNEVDPEQAAKLHTLDIISRKATQRDAQLDVTRRARR